MKYPYLNDREFLKRFDNETHKIQYTRIEVLDFHTEDIIVSIEGKSTGGSVNLSGTSNMRRAGSCSLLVDPEGIKMPGYSGEYQQYYNITEVQNLISMNKKIRIETGFDNSLSTLGYYQDDDIIWFPLGIFVITNASVSKNNSGINISLTLNDKCALLNGDMGGTIPAGTIFSETELYDSIAAGARKVEKILLKDIIKSIVVEFGGERPENIIIANIPDTIVKVVKWRGKTKLYFYKDGGFKHFSTTLYDDEEYKTANYDVFVTGQDVGYMNEPFVYPGTLECNAGEAVSAVLDKIKNALGNFEWFYDINGRFIFQKIRNNINENTATNFLDMRESDYLTYYNQTGSTYTFDNTNLITSISNNPQYKNIKNDFVVWGTKKTTSGAEKPIRYHLAFDSKPPVDINKKRLALVYKDYKGLWQPKFLKDDELVINHPEGSALDRTKIYLYTYTSEQEIKIWESGKNAFVTHKEPDYEICYLSTSDWRTELYYRGLEADNKSFNKNYYSAELNAEWPKIKNIKATTSTTGTWNGVDLKVYQDGYHAGKDKSNYDYWLDLLEGSEGGSESISQFSVKNIGRRTKIVSENSVNSIFPLDDYPNIVIVNADGDNLNDIELAEEKGQEVIQVSPDMFKEFSIGGGGTSAYEKIKDLIFTHTQYNESITLSVIPIYYLEPNRLISVFDRETGVYGEYLIKSISLPLTPNGTSNISATKALSKTI
jgi:hypothetical protein